MTVSIGGEDIDPALLSLLKQFLQKEAVAGKCSVEHGGTTFHLHLQMVVHIHAKSIIVVNRLIKQYLGWEKKEGLMGMVMCRSLKNARLHTFHGMSMKDLDEPHFATVDHNVTANDLSLGVE